MTPDERIDALLNRFGQTISDLPKPNKVEMGKRCYAYPVNHIFNVSKAVESWEPFESEMPTGMIIGRYKDYICHLADVIDRMEVALETALRVIDCTTCEKIYNYEKEYCKNCIGDNYRIDDRRLEGEDPAR